MALAARLSSAPGLVNWPVTRLIINADDFGLTSGVNRAILELHRQGVLTSATLMAQAAATDEAIAIARATPALGVGCHVVLVDGTPAAGNLKTLAPSGAFFKTLGDFLQHLLTGRIEETEIEAEARAQIQSLQSRGVALDHIDTHKHTHMFPRVLRPVLCAARACGVRSVRNPFEPAWSTSVTPGAPLVRRAEVRLLRLLSQSFLRIVAEEGFSTTAGSLGVLATGTLDRQTVEALVRAVPSSNLIYELVTHPGYNDADLAAANTRLLTSRDTERQALQVLRSTPAMNLISFADLPVFATSNSRQ